MIERIAAIVVTFNRLDDLQTGIAALRAQTRPLDEIIIINNGSTDGTKKWLETQPTLHVLHNENRGAGAAFALGLDTARERGFNWCWCMDDDAHPAPDALSALCAAITARPDIRVFNSLAMARHTPTAFAVGALWVRTAPDNYLTGVRVATLAGLVPYTDADGLVNSIGGHFYLGTLIHRSVIEKVGVPLAWLFIRGDEVEYSLRIMRAGYPIYAVVASRVYHPATIAVIVRLLNQTKAFETMSLQKRYYSTRNSIWIHRQYYAPQPLLVYGARRLAGAFLTELWLVPHKPWQERLAACDAALRGLMDGVRLRPPRDTSGNEILS